MQANARIGERKRRQDAFMNKDGKKARALLKLFGQGKITEPWVILLEPGLKML